MNEQLQEIYDNAKKAGACKEGLNWLSQFDTFEKVEKDIDAPEYFYWYAKSVIKGRWELGEKAISKKIWNSYNYARYILRDKCPLHNPKSHIALIYFLQDSLKEVLVTKNVKYR